MKAPTEAELLRVFVGETAKHGGRPLYEAIVEEAHRQGLAGATVLRATLGYGAHSQVHTAKVLHLAENLPMVVEIVDEPGRVAAFLPILDGLMTGCGGLVTLERVRVVAYRRDGA